MVNSNSSNDEIKIDKIIKQLLEERKELNKKLKNDNVRWAIIFLILLSSGIYIINYT